MKKPRTGGLNNFSSIDERTFFCSTVHLLVFDNYKELIFVLEF